MIKPAITFIGLMLSTPAEPVLLTTDVTIEFIGDYEERLPRATMERMCQQRNCDNRSRYTPAPSRSYPNRGNWQQYQTPRPRFKYRDYQDFRSPYRYQYEH